MNKKYFVLIFVVLALVAIAVFFPSRQSKLGQPISASTSSSTPIHEAVVLEDETSIPQLTVPFVNTSTKTSILFKELPASGRESAADIYVNGKRINDVYINKAKLIGESGISGESFSLFSFSPNNKYFGFKSIGSGGCCTLPTEIYVVDMSGSTSSIMLIRAPRQEPDYSGPKEEPGQAITPYIESYTWGSDDWINITFYFVGYFNDNKYYRVSPKEIWRYDLAKGSYTLTQTLSE